MHSDSVTTPASQRCVTSYPVRRTYHPGVVFPPAVETVRGVIDIHAHAHPGQQDALSTAKYASQSGMRGILFKTIVGEPDPATTTRKVQEQLNRWADEEGIEPITCWSGLLLGARGVGITANDARKAFAGGTDALWLPVFNHANTLHTVGGKPIWWDPSAHPDDHTEPMPWDEARKYGHYLLDDNGALLDDVCEVIRVCADNDAPLFFGHTTHPEIFAIAEEMDRAGFTRGVVDHPYSPFINLSVEEMQQLASVGITMNFTYDELSPLLGIDPAHMCAAIKAVGAEHCTISSDVGEPLFPNTVEAMRQIYNYMEAFGLSPEELDLVARTNPARIVGLNLAVAS